ncbi:pyruvate, water dikinase regulatory protein [Martelella endophytica]|uniref:Putative pyruvate, phosphate dikinase regulatory protein n=2 Tax=Pseudomonadota TaxID=1224 RepID=A0A0D5LVG6_MAREN|nr:pyruvate, water dikinase regulatory protein [Martelella endophytica]AJY47935.1 phosphate kinase [Martelella endophytica]
MENRKNFFHLHLVSDSTGETLISAGRAVSAQFGGYEPIEHVYPLIRSRKQLLPVLRAIDEAPGIVLYTLVNEELSALIDEMCRDMAVPCVNLLEPVGKVFQSYLGTASRRRSGAQHSLDEDYFARIEALNFAMDHDDGQMPESYDEADVVILGISRTSKTPTCVYLANRGIKAANIPIVPGADLPPSLYKAKKPLIVCLIASTGRISQVREFREFGSGGDHGKNEYTDRAVIAEELKYARSLAAQNDWPLLDVTRRSIEETAAAILALKDQLK